MKIKNWNEPEIWLQELSRRTGGTVFPQTIQVCEGGSFVVKRIKRGESFTIGMESAEVICHSRNENRLSKKCLEWYNDVYLNEPQAYKSRSLLDKFEKYLAFAVYSSGTWSDCANFLIQEGIRYDVLQKFSLFGGCSEFFGEEVWNSLCRRGFMADEVGVLLNCIQELRGTEWKPEDYKWAMKE